MTLLDLAQQYALLTERNGEWWGCCPLHQERTPSFSVNAEKGVFYCFGCGAKGDVYTFYMLLHHCRFPEAKRAIDGQLDPRPPQKEQQKKALAESLWKDFQVWYKASYVIVTDCYRNQGKALKNLEKAYRLYHYHPLRDVALEVPFRLTSCALGRAYDEQERLTTLVDLFTWTSHEYALFQVWCNEMKQRTQKGSGGYASTTNTGDPKGTRRAG